MSNWFVSLPCPRQTALVRRSGMVQAICSGPELLTTTSHLCRGGRATFVLNPSAAGGQTGCRQMGGASLPEPFPSPAAGCFSDGDLHPKAFEALLELGRGSGTGWGRQHHENRILPGQLRIPPQLVINSTSVNTGRQWHFESHTLGDLAEYQPEAKHSYYQSTPHHLC